MAMIERMNLKTKIALLVTAALLGMLCLVVYAALEMKRDLLNGRKEVIQSVLEATHSTLAAYQAQEAAGALT
jgi:methyl-accepting chemotaxis protein